MGCSQAPQTTWKDVGQLEAYLKKKWYIVRVQKQDSEDTSAELRYRFYYDIDNTCGWIHISNPKQISIENIISLKFYYPVQ